MRIGCVIVLWLFSHVLFSQQCGEIEIGLVHYYEGQNEDKTEVISYFIPCMKTSWLSFTLPAINYPYDSDPSTPPGIILFLLKNDPGERVLTVSEFSELLYRDVNDQFIYFDDDDDVIDVADLRGIGNVQNQYVLIPVMVSNIHGNDPSSWFEDDCVYLDPNQKLTIIENVKEYTFHRFNEITFTYWPSEIPITAYFDFEFTDSESGEQILYTVLDNRTFRLDFQRSQGIFSFIISWKNHDCQEVELGANWSFPTVNIVMDTVEGYRDIEICVPVRGFNIESITGFQFELAWDADSIELTAIKNIHPTLEKIIHISKVYSEGDQSKIYLEWETDAGPVSFPDSVVLFTWCGKARGEPGELVRMGWSQDADDTITKFTILGLETDHQMSEGGIRILEDRELFYDISTLCTTRDGNHRIQLEIKSEDAVPYTITVYPGGFSDSLWSREPYVINNLLPGEYKITIRDSFGFEKVEMYDLVANPDPGFVMQVDESTLVSPTCLNPFGGEMSITIFPEDESYDLRFLNDDALFTGPRAHGLVGGHYIIEAENNLGCIDTLHFTLPPPSEIQVSWNQDALVLCPGTEAVYLDVQQTGTSDPTLEFRVQDGDIYKIGEILSFDHPGEYPLQFWNGDGCVLDTSVLVLGAPEEMMVWDTNLTVLMEGDTLSFRLPSHPDLTEVIWIYNGNTVGWVEAIVFTPGETGILSYSAIIYDQCLYADTLHVEVIHPRNPDDISFDFPNAFTPNGDGINDMYTLFPTREIRRIRKMEIFDRYGNYVYSEQDAGGSEPVFAWDGQSAGIEVPPGVYPVVLEVEFQDGQYETLSFEVTLIR